MIQSFVSLVQSLGREGFLLGILLEEIIVPLPSSLIMLAGGFLLVSAQTWPEAIKQIFPSLVIIGAFGVTLGSLFFYLLSYFGGEITVRKVGPKLGLSFVEVEKFRKRLRRQSLDEAMLLVFRALPIFPGVVVNVIAGLIRMPVLNFIIFGFLGSCLRVFLMTFLGWQLKEAYLELAWQIEKISSVISLIFFFILVMLFLIYLKRANEKSR